MTNQLELEERIKKSGYTKTYVAKRCGLSLQGFLPKVHGERDFKQSEIKALMDLLRLTPNQVIKFFLS